MALKIAFLIRSLERGGAERQLVALVKGLHAIGYDVAVFVFYAGGYFEEELATCGVAVNTIGKRSRWESLSFLLRAKRILCSEAPDILHSYLGGANIVAALLKPWLKPTRIVWGFRAARLAFRTADVLSRLSAFAEVALARAPDLIIANSEAGMRYAVGIGFPQNKTIVVPNGIDLEKFRIDFDLRARTRKAWRVSHEEFLIGRVGRIDPVKDYPGFLRMAALVVKMRPNVKFVCVGGGPADYLTRLQELAVELGISESIIWAGAVDEMCAAYNALDLLASTSISEGFPNVLLEAMACGVPCVATDVGDSRLIVAGSGAIVEYGDTQGFADACLRMLKASPEGRTIRREVEERFGLREMVRRTEEQLIALIQDKGECLFPAPSSRSN